MLYSSNRIGSGQMPKTLDQVQQFLDAKGVRCEQKAIPNGVSFRCEGGEIFNRYDNGSINEQGKTTELTKAFREWKSADDAAWMEASKTIFIVYGHDARALDDLELAIRRMGLKPIILAKLPSAGDTIIEKLEQYVKEYGKIAYACVLATADDEGHKKNEPSNKKLRARQNVVLELGMVLSRLGRKRVVILLQEGVEKPSDIDGLIYVSFKEGISEARSKLYQEFSVAGLDPKVDGLS
jgi:predicted nucleotide-binding protein